MTRAVGVHDQTDVAEARRVATRVADLLGLPEADAARVALVATEIGTNLLKHAGGGELLVRAATDAQHAVVAVELIAIDTGPGMADVDACLEDGYSTAGSHGIGLGAVTRASLAFDIYSGRDVGTALVARVGRTARAPAPMPPFTLGVVNVSYPGEPRCGDSWAVVTGSTRATVLVADGLGHGAAAADAAGRARELFLEHHGAGPAAVVELLHLGLRNTRGAALAVAELDCATGTVRYCGLGNVAGSIVSGGASRQMVSMNGTAGHEGRRIREFEYGWLPGGLLVMHSDGLQTRWKLDAYPGLSERDPALVAAVLYRDAKRGRDDVTVIAMRAR